MKNINNIHNIIIRYVVIYKDTCDFKRDSENRVALYDTIDDVLYDGYNRYNERIYTLMLDKHNIECTCHLLDECGYQELEFGIDINSFDGQFVSQQAKDLIRKELEE